MTIKFVNLHGHSTFSMFDGFAYPDKHIDACLEKGMNSLALTDHGTMAGASYQVLHSKKLDKKGIDFKPIYGVEAYYIDSFSEWQKEYSESVEEDEEDDKKVKIDEEDRKSNKKRYAHIVLLAKNETGYKNLCKIVSASNGKYFYRKPRVDYDLLKENSEGIVALSACLAGPFSKMMWDWLEANDSTREEFLEKLVEKNKKFQEIFGDDWYAELQWNAIKEQHIINSLLIDLHKKTGVKLVSTCDAHYPNRDDWNAREIYKKLGWVSTGEANLDVDKDSLPYELYIKSGDELFSEYKRYSEITNNKYDDEIVLRSIEESANIADKIVKFYPDSTAKFPHFIIDSDKNADDELERMCRESLTAFGLDKNEKYISRLELELDTIKSRGFCEYFLTMKKISDFARENFLTGPGRGSAAGSLISYLLQITQVDPLKANLLFSRFLRKDAEGYPDIDYDVSSRDKLVSLLIKNWGENTVVSITNWNTLSLKSLTKDLAKLLDIPFQEVNEVTKVMDDQAKEQAKEEAGIKSGEYDPTLDEYIKFSEAFSDFLEKYPDIEKYLRLLEGQIRAKSRHAGGVIVCDNLNEKMPMIRGASLNKEDKEDRINNGLSPYIYQTPWTEGQNVRHLEPLGFIKFDILGLETLSIMENTIRRILQKNGETCEFKNIKKFYDKHLHPDSIDRDNEQIMTDVFHNGKWAGIFQFAESGAQKFCQQIKPRSIEELSAITAIYRPGPLGAKVHEKYLEAKKWPEKVKYYHPLHKEVSENTYGFLIYQEQIAMLAHKLGKNISLDEGDLLRKVLTKKGTGKDDVKDKIKFKFIEGCIEKGLSETTAEEIWEKFVMFAGYGFNKSHAFCYSFISYQCAWLLFNYPDEWLASFLDSKMNVSKPGVKEEAINIARSLGYDVGKIDINLSSDEWTATSNKELVQPLTSIKGIGDKALKELLRCRPFNSIEDFIFHPSMDYRRVSKKITSVLVQTGALDSIIGKFSNRKHLYMTISDEKLKSKKQFDEKFEKHKSISDYTNQEKYQFIHELCGIYPFHQIVPDHLIKKLEKVGCIPISSYTGVGASWGVLKSCEYKKTSGGKDYAILTFTDSSFKEVNVKCWSWKFSDKPELDSLYLLKLKHDKWGFSSNNWHRDFRVVKDEASEQEK